MDTYREINLLGRTVLEMTVDIKTIQLSMNPYLRLMIEGGPIAHDKLYNSYSLKNGWKLEEIRTEESVGRTFHIYRFTRKNADAKKQ